MLVIECSIESAEPRETRGKWSPTSAAKWPLALRQGDVVARRGRRETLNPEP